MIRLVPLHGMLCRCDRILWLGKGIKQLAYTRAEILLSDHRPVSSTFLVQVEVLDHRKLKRALNVSSAVVHPDIFLDEDGELELQQLPGRIPGRICQLSFNITWDHVLQLEIKQWLISCCD